MSTRLPGFRGEYLWEYDIAEQQLLALAEAFPAERYEWRPVETARSVSEVLVHLGMGCRTLLVLMRVEAAPDLYAELEGEGVARVMAMIKRNENQEKSVTNKAAVLSLLRKSLDAVRAAFTEASDGSREETAVRSRAGSFRCDSPACLTEYGMTLTVVLHSNGAGPHPKLGKNLREDVMSVQCVESHRRVLPEAYPHLPHPVLN